MKLDFSFLETPKNRVTRVTTVTPADNAACIGNPSKNERVTRVTFSEDQTEKVTQVTQVKTEGLPIESAPDAEVTPVTQVTRKNIETENKKQVDDAETVVLLRADSATETAPAMFAPAEPETKATGGTGGQSRHALPCSENDKALLAYAVSILTDDFLRTAPADADQIIRAFNTVEAAELADNQADFDFALSVLRSAVDGAVNKPGSAKVSNF